MASEGIENFQGVVTTVAVVAGAVIAWMGLSTWKDQIKWNADAELAKRILEAIYRHSTSLKRVRFPAIFPTEKEAAISGKELPKEGPLRRYLETASVYEARWNGVISARSDLQPLIFEAQVIWENDFGKLFGPLWVLEDELFKVVRLHLESMNPDNSEQTKAEFLQMKVAERNILYFTNEATDLFNADYENALHPLLGSLRRRLGRR